MEKIIKYQVAGSKEETGTQQTGTENVKVVT